MTDIFNKCIFLFFRKSDTHLVKRFFCYVSYFFAFIFIKALLYKFCPQYDMSALH